jgi:hypothetical protein
VYKKNAIYILAYIYNLTLNYLWYKNFVSEANMTVTNNTILKALYETKRQQLIIAWNTPAVEKIENAYVYAYERRICPIFHIDQDEDDPFVDVYKIPRNFVEEVIEYADSLWIGVNKDLSQLTFYKMENKFKGKGNRSDLIAVFRYAFLNHNFDEEFFKALRSDCPTEAHNINRPLEDVYL